MILGTNKFNSLMKFKLKGSYKRNGIETFRFIFNGQEKSSGQEATFFVELSFINPYLSPNEATLGYKSRVSVSEDDLQNVLVGSVSAKRVGEERLITPSYIAIRAGILGQNAKEIVKYTCIKDVTINYKQFYLKADECCFTLDSLVGRIVYTQEELDSHPEYLCDSGGLAYNLRYEAPQSFSKGYNGKQNKCFCPGAKTLFTGAFVVDGVEYIITPYKSFGYIEHFWGRDLPATYFHISTSNMISIISGKTLPSSFFSVQGSYEDRLSLLLNVEGKELVFTENMGKRNYDIIWSVTEAPDANSKDRLHLSVSLHSKQYVIDIDVYNLQEDLCVHSRERARGERQLLKILASAAGNGELKIYKKVTKSLELIEQARLVKTLCEYGKLEEKEE